MALTEELKGNIQRCYREWLESNDCKPRRPQREMIAHIARCLAAVETDEEGLRLDSFQNQLCIVQAGTGTGKTLAYSIASIVIAQALDKKVVLSTATVALQEQLLNKDLPNLLESTSLDFSLAIAKGRSRYLCLSKLSLRLKEAEGLAPPQGLFPDEQGVLSQSAKKSISILSKAVGSGEACGEFDSLPDDFDHENWHLVAADRNSCSGKQCSNYRDCYLFNARDEVRKSDVIVANHDLVLADLTLGGGNVLPPPEETIYVFDEGHHLPEKSRNHLSVSFGLQAQRKQLANSQKIFAHLRDVTGISADLLTREKTINQLDETIKTILAAVDGVVGKIVDGGGGFDGIDSGAEGVYRFVNGIVEEDLRQHFADLQTCFLEKHRQLSAISSGLADAIKEVGDGDTVVHERGIVKGKSNSKKGITTRERLEAALSLVSHSLAQVDNALAVCDSYANCSTDDPYARWLLESDTSATARADVSVFSVPLSTASILKRILWKRCFSAVVTSATLAPAGNFKHFFSKLGHGDEVRSIQLLGEFNYADAVFYVPQMQSSATNAILHTEELIELIPNLVDSTGGSLVLFSSRKQMMDVAQELEAALDVLVQGERSKQKLLDLHRERVDKGGRSVLFGLASFAEGLDLPGDYCKEVVIAKLPFSVPDGPVDKAMAEWVESRGGNPFYDISLPDAAIRLMQSSGRLLRKDSDEGRITLLDRRIVAKSYGKQLLAALPPYRLEVGR